MNPTIYSLHQGELPLLLSMPHNGTALPAALAARMTAVGRAVPDTDWLLDRLYDFAPALGVSVLNPLHSRYVIDLNRAPDGVVLYAGMSNTELCPTTSFDEEPLYPPGEAPNATEIGARIAQYWQPYHRAIETELARLVRAHGYAILFDAHSIQSRVPRFFDGTLPDINFGTAAGASASARLEETLSALDYGPHSHVFNGRFKGGYITRHYGAPQRGVHAIQLELAQCNYMEEATREWREDRAGAIKPLLKRIVEALLAIAPEQLRAGR
jgi:N-formylglutamate deformylase